MVAYLNTQFACKTPSIQIVATFHNGKDALSFLEKNEADLLLLDLYMPDISGLEILKALRNRDNKAGVIMITAANDAKHVEESINLGVIDYLVKPFRYERFSTAIQKYILQRNMIERGGKFTQEDIDRLISSPSETNRLQKGLQQKTLDTIIGTLRKHPHEFLTCEQISEEAGLSKVTVRHYLNYLIECYEAVSRINYSTGGRPSIEYSIPLHLL